MKIKSNFKLILIRHGESLSNLQPELIGGRSPQVKLSPKGELQAANLGKYFLKLGQKLDVIYSSLLARSRQTAELCLDNYNPKLIDKIQFDDRLMEFSQGDWENKPRNEIYTLETQNIINRQKSWFRPPSGESLRMVKNRATNFLETEIINKFYAGQLNNQTVAIFGHGMWIKALLMEILGLDQIITVNLQIDNCGLTELEFDDFGWKLVYLNRVAI